MSSKTLQLDEKMNVISGICAKMPSFCTPNMVAKGLLAELPADFVDFLQDHENSAQFGCFDEIVKLFASQGGNYKGNLAIFVEYRQYFMIRGWFATPNNPRRGLSILYILKSAGITTVRNRAMNGYVWNHTPITVKNLTF